MSYNTTPRRSLTKKQRGAFLINHGSRCHWCKQLIEPGQPWAVDHLVPRELMAGGAEGDDNLAPIHAHPLPCHKEKTAQDIAMIAKSNRIRRSNGPAEQRKKTKHPIRSKGFAPGQRSIPSRPFPKRLK